MFAAVPTQLLMHMGRITQQHPAVMHSAAAVVSQQQKQMTLTITTMLIRLVDITIHRILSLMYLGSVG